MKKIARWKPWLVAAVVVCICAALRHSGVEVRARVAHADRAWLLLAVALCILYRIVNSTGWVLVLRALGHPMPVARGARIWIVAETMRWLPGSVWGFCSRLHQAGKAGAPPAVAAASLPLELLLTIAAWALTAGGAMFASGLAFDWMAMASPHALPLVGAAVVLFSATAWLARGRLKKLLHIRPQPGLLALTLLLYTALCAFNGLAFYCVLRSLSGAPLSVAAAIGANAFGWLAGFFAIGVPGGIGVREAASAMVLTAVMPVETVLAAAVLWRLVLIVDEVCCLAVLLAPSAWKRLAERAGLASSLAADLAGPRP